MAGGATSLAGMAIFVGLPIITLLAVGIERVFQSAGYVPLIANTAESVIRQAEVLKSIRERLGPYVPLFAPASMARWSGSPTTCSSSFRCYRPTSA